MKFYYKIINVIFVFYFICITNLYSTDIKSNTTLTDVATYIFKNLKEYSYPFYDVGKKYYGIDSSGNITVDPKQVNGKPYQPQQIINPDSIGTLCRDYHKREYIARSLRTEERWVDTSSAGTGFSQKLILKSDDMIFIMGDIHGSVHSLLRSILQLAAWGWLDNNFKIIQPNFKMIFLGDFVDRGRYSLEVVYMLLRLKVANFNNVFLLKGNHEEKNINEFYGLKTECNDKNTEKQYGTINDVFFGNLPLAIYVGCPKWNNKYLQFCHAGIHLENFSVNKSIDDLNKAGAKPCSIENPSIFTPKEMLKNVSQYCYQAIPKS